MLNPVYFAAKLVGNVPGNFGPKTDEAGRKAFADTQRMLSQPAAADAIRETDDTVEFRFDVTPAYVGDGQTRKVAIIPRLNSLPANVIDGVEVLRSPISEIQSNTGHLAARLERNAVRLQQVRDLQVRLDQLDEELVLSLYLDKFLIDKRSASGTRLSQTNLELAERLASLLSDPEVKAAFQNLVEYKSGRVEISFKENDIDAYLRANGMDGGRQSEDGTYDRYEALMKDYEAEVIDSMSVKFSFKNMNFIFDPKDAGLRDPNHPSSRYSEVRFSVDDLKERPDEIKKALIEANTYWNEQIQGYIG